MRKMSFAGASETSWSGLPTLILLFVVLVLGGCTTSQMAFDSISQQWMGRHSDDFFTQYGMPFQSYKLDNGGMLVGWSSGVRSLTMPETTTYRGSVSPSGSFYGVADTSGGGTMDLVCVLQIRTDGQRRITGITITKDTWGMWETSACNEVFG